MDDSRTEVMKNLDSEIEKLEQDDRAKLNISYRIYIGRLQALNTAMKEQYQKDSFGLDKALTPALLDSFRKLYREAGEDGEKLIGSLPKDLPAIGVLKNIQKLLSTDLQALGTVDERTLAGGTISLQRVIDDARTQTVDISGRNLKPIGGNQSSRIPFNHVEADGTELPGVFTAKKHLDVIEGYEEIITDMKQQYPEIADYFAAYREGACKLKKEACLAGNVRPTEKNTLMMAIGDLMDKHGKVNYNKLRVCFRNALQPDTFDAFEDALNTLPNAKEALVFFGKRVATHYTTVMVNIYNAGVADKSRIDSRNSAMSAVADLLGVPKLICRALPMKIKQDGKETEGTFMCMAEGVDIKTPPDICLTDPYQSTGPVFQNTNGLKDIADLQVLDFICGNVDRHCGNLFYRFDSSNPDPAKHRFLGVQGIDNDASFGTFVPKNRDQQMNRLPALNNMKVISRSMADRLAALNPEMLAFMLRNQGLEEAQITAAQRRLTILRDYIAASTPRYERLLKRSPNRFAHEPNYVIRDTIRIVEDSEFSKLSLTEMAKTEGNTTNCFSMVEAFREVSLSEKLENPDRKPLEAEKIAENPVFTLRADEAKKAADWVKALKDATSLNRTSDYFKAIQAAAERYRGFCEANKGAVLSEDLYAIRKAMLADLRDAAADYAKYKASVTKPSSYTRNRMEVAARIGQEAGEAAKENFYADQRAALDPEARKRCADGLHKYADRSLDEFNAKMRKLAEEIHARQPQRRNAPPAAENGVKAPAPGRR